MVLSIGPWARIPTTIFYHCTQNDYRTELYYFRIIFGNSCSVITEPNCFWNLLGLGTKCVQRITEPLPNCFGDFGSVIRVEELPNRNCFGINLVIFLCAMVVCAPPIRDAEMTIKIIFERSSQKGVSRGFEKRVNRGPILKFYCWPKAQEKQHFGKWHFYCRRFFPGNIVTSFGQLPPFHPPGCRTRVP